MSVFAQLQEHNQLHNHSQSVYKSRHSTETALLKNNITTILSEGHAALLVLLDWSAAFDTTDHSVLLNRLTSCFGIHGTPLAWFKSYLTHRSEAVKVGESVSKPKVSSLVSHRVPYLVPFSLPCTCTPHHLARSYRITPP